MTVRDALYLASRRLRGAGVETPWLDAWVLLENHLGMDRAQLFASYPEQLSEPAERAFRDLITARVSGRPVSYLIGKKEFYGLTFLVDESVLVPRPDSEALVEQVLETVAENPWIHRVHDCCTGSGCIAIALAHERPDLAVSASDVSASALKTATLNATRILDRDLEFVNSDLLGRVHGTYDLITANPPYLTSVEYEQMRRDGWPEPEIALDGGPDGLDAYRKLIPQAMESLAKGGYLFLEAADNQVEGVCFLLAGEGYRDVGRRRDLGGRLRVCWGRRV
jgi:release factor glutamine methyltransferase